MDFAVLDLMAMSHARHAAIIVEDDFGGRPTTVAMAIEDRLCAHGGIHGGIHGVPVKLADGRGRHC